MQAIKLGEVSLICDTGRFLCMLCNTNWCEHIEIEIKTGEDQKFIWYREENCERRSGILLEIPMFPTVEQWTTVDLSINENAPMPMYTVKWHDNFICNVTQGEGRQVIRICLIEYMYSQPDRQMTCSDSSHAFAEQMRWEKDQKSLQKFAQDWTVFVTRKCISCLEKFDPNAMSPDLVPDKQNAWT